VIARNRRKAMTTARDKIAEIMYENLRIRYDNLRMEDGIICGIEEAADAILAALPDMIAPLEFQDMGRGYWGAKPHGYQVAWCSFTDYRVRLNGRVICRKIKGYHEAIDFANAHNREEFRKQLPVAPTGERP
jgi:hypothetical protein